MATLTLRDIGRRALDLLYPPRCAICGADGDFLCPDCLESLPRADGQRCDRCWLPLRAGTCPACAEHPSSLTHLRSAFRYENDVRKLVHAFKFAGQSSLAPSLGKVLAETLERHSLAAGAFVPVPLTTGRQRHRGYNQAHLLARELSKHTGIPVIQALRRRGHSNPQATSASAEQRRFNVDGAFSLSPHTDIAGASLLLIDDVATTGATLNACARVLLEGGADAVSALTLARED